MAKAVTKTNKLAPEMVDEIASSRDGNDITQPWVGQLLQPRDPRLMSSVDWGVYDRIRMDSKVKSCLEQRISAVVSAEWDVLPGDEEDPRSVEAADNFKAMIAKTGWDRVTAKMLLAPFNGYAVAEIVWQRPRAGELINFKVKVRHARRFRYDKDGKLRLLTRGNRAGVIMPDRKFWVVTAGATNDDEPYGHGLADWLYWPTLFKRNGIRFWNLFLDKYGSPTTVGTFRRGTPKAERDKLLAAVMAAATDSGIIVPEGTKVELLQAAMTAGGSFEQICRYMDEAIAQLILSQTMTSADGSSLSQAKVHAGVKLELVKSDADLLSDSFNDDGPAAWWCDLNYGPDVAPPKLVRLVEEEEDLKVLAETDAVLDGTGWQRTDESFRDTYGDGFERKAAPVPANPATPAAKDATPASDPATNDNLPGKDAKVASFAASDPRPLYVYRRLKNAKDVIAWAKAQGFTATLPAKDMHVTVAYSRRALNWFNIDGIWMGAEMAVNEGGARVVDKIGSEGAVALHFVSNELTWRNKEIREAGASWDFPSYQPHVTLTYSGAPDDLSKVQPYTGKLVFGPEIFEPLDADWDDGVNEVSFAETLPRDLVDEAVTTMLENHGWKPLTPAMQAVITALENSNTAEEFDMALLQALPEIDREPFAQMMGRAGFALRMDGETSSG